ncbi:MAG: outer membrane protein assembly factor BamA [Proteobacteria bacterium]|nr:outer membrane protein assembly factor BamA [Pseudomonadota bacterium]NOG60821.1 outer membrane protein assembly factor BamA [Pseudomonadota bacterium]
MQLILKKLLYISVLMLSVVVSSQAAQEFVIEDIRVEGLERITPGTVFNYLPMKVGDTFDDSRSSEAVRALFKTGLFDDVRLERDGNILVFLIKERPAIGSITMSGNEDIKTDDLLANLKQFGFAEGRVFVQSQLDQTEQELERQYYSLGKYAVKINSTVTELDNNRVGILIEVSEGLAAKIKKINIVGNTVFEEKKLLKQFKLSTPTWLSFYTKNDQYSKQKLSGDLETLRSYYLDNGYLNFNIESTQVSITPDKKDIYITINISEGEQYTVTDVKLAGELILPEQDLFELISIGSGELFSRKEVTDSSKRLTERLGEEGYSFANVNSIPDINKEDKTVSLTFFVDPSKRVYVRRINFAGNSKTRDEVLRREMRQQEGAWISTKQVERGKQRLQRTGYFKDVNVDTPAVAGTTDQVDVNYSVEEASGGQIGIGLGFSQGQGLILNTSISQDNFLGSGKSINFAFNNSDVNTRYQLGFLDPYYTDDGISRGFNAFYRVTDAQDANLALYETKEYGGSVNFRIPVTENNSFGTEFSYSNTELDLLGGSSSQLSNFVAQNGDSYDLIKFSASFAHDTRNKKILPDKGVLHSIGTQVSVPSFGDSLTYYKVNARTQWFKDIYKDYILTLGAEFGYGDSYGDTTELPFFENFFAGGPKSVRGYEENTLGPRDSLNRPLGGDRKVLGNAEVILPVPFLSEFKKSVRVTGFVDAGNVYGPNEDLDLSELRYSTGLSAIWISPFGAISMSMAFPVNEKSTDEVQNFQFTFGTSF